MYAIKGIKKISYWGIQIIIKSQFMVIAENDFVNWSHLVMAHLIINAHLIAYKITSVKHWRMIFYCAKYLAKILVQKWCILMFYYWPWQMLNHLITILICIIYTLPRCLLLWSSCMSRPFIKTCTFLKHKWTMLRFICHPFPLWFSLIWSLAPVPFYYVIQYCTILGTAKDFPTDLQWRMQIYSKH